MLKEELRIVYDMVMTHWLIHYDYFQYLYRQI